LLEPSRGDISPLEYLPSCSQAVQHFCTRRDQKSWCRGETLLPSEKLAKITYTLTYISLKHPWTRTLTPITQAPWAG